MDLPDYVTVDEVKRVCKEIGIRDWTEIKTQGVTQEEARKILDETGSGGMDIEPEEFRRGLEVELEHGTALGYANVTNNHPILTGKIVLAHFRESLDYYRLLEVAELRGDLLNAAAAGDAEKLLAKFGELVEANKELGQAESARLSR